MLQSLCDHQYSQLIKTKNAFIFFSFSSLSLFLVIQNGGKECRCRDNLDKNKILLANLLHQILSKNEMHFLGNSVWWLTDNWACEWPGPLYRNFLFEQ